MSARATKLQFLERVIACSRTGHDGPSALMTSDDFARVNVLVACEAIQLGLVRLHRAADGHELRITRAGLLLAAGHVEEAAACIDSGMSVTRLAGDPPEGLLGLRLHPGSQGIPLHSSSARQFAPEMMRGVATGHLVVSKGIIHASNPAAFLSTGTARLSTGTARDSWLPHDPASAPKGAPAESLQGGFPSSRSGRHVAIRNS